MSDSTLTLVQIGMWLLLGVGLIAAYRLILRLFFGCVIIPQDSIGIVNKNWALGRHLPDGCIIALNGEAGWQADTLAPGVYFGLWPWQYEVNRAKFVAIEPGKIGVVEARDGKPMSGGRVLARTVACSAFQDARAFLTSGGERGPQIAVIPPGTYRINTAAFKVEPYDVLEVKDNMVGIVTVKDGAPLATGEIAGKEITGHNSYQDAESFITGGGHKGLQEQVILAGRYFLNPRFATVEPVQMTAVPIANVGVVIAYVGAEGVDVTGESFKHGNLVKRGQKGVWVDPLDPGKYPINPYTHKVENVPTANVVLNWANDKSEAHKLDERLSTITVRSSDGFTFNLDVSQIIHIPRADAPKVIARFGSVANLVTQVLEPTIGNYFRNAAQKSDVIDFLKNRTARQKEAKDAISACLSEYNVVAVDTLIGDIAPPADLMKTLTDRKLAEQEKVTYETQRLAEETRKELEQARAMAATQANVVGSERKVAIAEFDAQSSVKRAEGEAKATVIKAEADANAAIQQAQGLATSTVRKAQGDAESRTINATATATAVAKEAEGQGKAAVNRAAGDAQAKRLNAEADAAVVTLVGNADAGRIKAIGQSEAEVIKLKIDSMESGNYAIVQVAQTLAENKTKLVPDILVTGGSASGNGTGSGGGTLIDVLLANLLTAQRKHDNA